MPLISLLLFPAAIAHDDAMHHGPQQIMEPLRLRAFLEGDVNRPPHAPEVLHQRGCLRRQHAAREHTPAFLAHRRHCSCLMHVEADILA